MTETELKKQFESPRIQLKLGVTGLVVFALLTLAFFTVFFDPFRRLDGPPEVHEAKKWIVLCIGFILLPAASGIWFMVIHPLRTGITTRGRWDRNMNPHIVLRSEEPVRFRLHIFWNCVLLTAALAFGFGALRSFIRDLEKAKSQPVHRNIERA